MTELRFEWDLRKAVENRRKDGVSFEAAESVFSAQEDRFLLLGLSMRLRTVVVSHCYRKEADLLRIISARKATRRERAVYNRRWRR